MAYLNSKPKTPEVCPVCGEDVSPRALACPECGADHKSGWREDADFYNADLPDEDFDYDEFAAKEFGNSAWRLGIKPIWWITAIVVLGLTILTWVLSLS